MELNLSLGGDHQYAASKRKTTSNIGCGGLMESPVGFKGGRSSGEEVSGSRAEDGDRLLLLLPLLGGRRKREARVIEQSNEADGMVVTARKKLKLSKEQSSFLEQSFKEHQTLGSNEKLAIAKRLNLRPRQVEVWFQNRRARTKLKNMEEDYAYLRGQCKSLTEENMRLQQELLQLRALKALPAVHHPPLTALTIRPSCRSMDPAAASASAPIN